CINLISQVLNVLPNVWNLVNVRNIFQTLNVEGVVGVRNYYLGCVSSCWTRQGCNCRDSGGACDATNGLYVLTTVLCHELNSKSFCAPTTHTSCRATSEKSTVHFPHTAGVDLFYLCS